MLGRILNWLMLPENKMPSSKSTEALGRQIALECLEEVRQRVAGRTGGMAMSEIRGYLRARAARTVRRQVNLAILQHPQACQAWAEAVTCRATERIVPLLMTELSTAESSPWKGRAAA